VRTLFIRLGQKNRDEYRYQIGFKNLNGIVSVEAFRIREDLVGACAVIDGSFKTTNWIIEEVSYSINKFIADFLSKNISINQPAKRAGLFS
jgi:hypothetical protein